MKKTILWILGLFGLLFVLIFIASFFIEESIRKRIENAMNKNLQDYSVQIGKLDLHPIGFSLDLEGIKVKQKDHPDPAVAEIGQIKASVHWRKLLNARLVADFTVDKPRVYLNPQNLKVERKDKKAVHEKGWQDALQSAYPLKINQLVIRDGSLLYVMKNELKPVRLSGIRFEARNIRNIDYEDQTYPSDITLEAVVFEEGKLSLSGNMNFLLKPHPGGKANLSLSNVRLGYIAPIAAQHNIDIRQGTASLEGNGEYAAAKRRLILEKVVLNSLEMDYVHRRETAAKEEEKAKKVKEAAGEVAEKKDTVLKIGWLEINKGNVGFVNRAEKPDYRIFFDDIDLNLENFSNHFSEGPAKLVMKGDFMGSGPSTVYGSFRSEKNGPDFDLRIGIEKTPVVKMNNLFRAYGNFDVTAGQFSFFSEIHVKNQDVKGYLKPLFKDMKVYDRRQDKEKNLFRKLYEKVVGGLARLLENPIETTATKTEITGELGKVETNTWQTVINLIRNAFFRSILPGFEESIR